METPQRNGSEVIVEGLAYEVADGAATRRLLDGVSFTAPSGAPFTILGPSGSGKSTLLRCLNRLVEPTEGSVLVGGTAAAELPVQELRRRVGMVFQQPALFDGTVRENVLYGPRLRAKGEPTGERAAARARALLRRVGLPGSLCERPANSLSGGEAQRVSLARTLANEPSVLLLDEPTASLDPTAERLIEELLLGLMAETGITLIFVTHNLAQARRLGGSGLLLVSGSVVERGALPTLLDSPAHELTRRFAEGDLS